MEGRHKILIAIVIAVAELAVIFTLKDGMLKNVLLVCGSGVLFVLIRYM